MGRKNETFEGLVVKRNLTYEFYPSAKGCERRGTPYLIVPNGDFYEMTKTIVSVDQIEDLFRGEWHRKLKGNLSRLGRYGPDGEYWRELSPIYVIDSKSLDCKGKP